MCVCVCVCVCLCVCVLINFSGLLYPRVFYAIFLGVDFLTCLKSNNPCQGTEGSVYGFKDNASDSHLGYESFYS